MTSRFLCISFALLGGCGWMTAADQDATSHSTFEVASIKPSPPPDPASGMFAMSGMPRDALINSRPPGWLPMDKARVTIRGWTPAQLIAAAYRLRADHVSGPAWISELRFDIEAKIPEGASKDRVNEMLQSLLAERFGLKLHKEEAAVSGYALVVAKGGLKLKPVVPRDESRADVPLTPEMKQKREADMKQRLEQMARTMRADGGDGGATASSAWHKPDATMADLADRLAVLIHKPVVDMTEVAGKYDLDIQVSLAAGDSWEYGISQAIAKLGLKLESRKISTVTLVVDHLEKAPTGN